MLLVGFQFLLYTYVSVIICYLLCLVGVYFLIGCVPLFFFLLKCIPWAGIELFLSFQITLFKTFFKIVAIATAALEVFKNEAKKMVVALVDMERAFVPPQHFIRLVQRR